MSPREVAGLHALALKHGGSLTINPDTGLPEAGFLDKLLPTIIGGGISYLSGGLIDPMTAAAMVGGVETIRTGSLERGLMAGFGAYGGAGLAQGFMGAGSAALGTNAVASTASELMNAGAGEALTGEAYNQAMQQGVTDRLAGLTKEATFSAGLDAAKAAPLDFAKNNFKYLASTAAPILADQMVPTTTKAPPVSPSFIRQKRVNPDGTVTDLTPVNAADWGSRNFSDIYRGYNGGGIVALAEGGAGADAINKAVEANKYFEANPDVAKAYEANAYGLTPQQFAQTHYEKYGQTEQRAPVGIETLAPAPAVIAPDVVAPAGIIQLAPATAATTPPPAVAPPPLSPTDAYQVAPSQSAAATQYLRDNPDVASWLTSEQGKAWTAQHPNFDAQDIAWTHYKKFGEKEQRTWGVPPTTVTPVTPVTPVVTTPQTNAPAGTTNPYGNATNPGDLTYNADGTITVQPNIPGRPYGGFSGMGEVKNAYTQGGGSLGYTPYVPKTAAEHEALYNKQTGDSLAAYNYLMGKGAYPTKSTVGEIARPYSEATLGFPASTNKMYNWDAAAGKMVRNPDYVATGRNAKGDVTYGMSLNDIKKYLDKKPLQGASLYNWAKENSLSAQDIAAATGMTLSEVYAQFREGQTANKATDAADTGTVNDGGQSGGYAATGGLQTSYAMGGYAMGGGLGSLGSYSDGGRLLKGPGDGVSDSIPATIGRKQQPARLADGEFVVPARIVSELGNGSTEAGAKKLYAMMDRVQRARGKTTGKNKVAANSRSDKYLPA
jgi:hypothetical protein